jgi:hypothetical protein
MNSEHIRLSAYETIYGEKLLLQSQLDILNIMKRSRAYKKMRDEELLLKIQLKTKIDECLNDLQVLEKALPKPTMKEGQKEFPEAKLDKERFSLEQEIEEIKRKLSRLQY